MSRSQTPPPPPTESDPPPIQARLADPPAPGGTGRHARILQSRAAVLAAIFLGTGAFGVPLLWLSGKFSRAERIVWTLLAILYTLAMIAILVIAVRWMIDRLLVAPALAGIFAAILG